MLYAITAATRGRADEPVNPKAVPEPTPNTKHEAIAGSFSMDRARQFLDTAALSWTHKQGCFTCHTNYAYLYARPHLAGDGAAQTEVRRALEDLVTKRWPDKGPRWDAEIVASAAALAYHDAMTTGKLHPVTRTALDRIWKVQRKDGGFSWLKCGWPPMENDDHYGVTLAAIATGVAPEGYASTETARRGLDGIRGYLKANPPQNLHHKAMMLWASTYVDDICGDSVRAATIKELLALQRPDGGWSAASLGTWKRADKLEQDPRTSDGYGTGFVLFVLRRARVSAREEAVERGIAWLKANQRESGRWFTRSLNRDNKNYLSHAGTAFAVMALSMPDTAGLKQAP
jgi:squalene-hopene/tetraprenyl-beta-curcumene cyclase